MSATTSRVVLAIACASACGGSVGDHPPPEPPLTVESSPWIVAFERPPQGLGPLRAARFADWKVESVVLDPSASTPPSWSPSGRWIAYRTRQESGAGALWMRQLDGDVWKEPRLVASASYAPGFGALLWSPKGDRLHFDDRLVSRAHTIGVATPQPDGSVAVNVLEEAGLDTNGRVSAEWTPDGDRLVLSMSRGSEERIVAYDATTSLAREIAPPSGSTFNGNETLLSGQSAISPDGRWLCLRVRTPDDGVLGRVTLHAHPLGGVGEAREMPECLSGGTADEACAPWSWHPDGATLLVQRRQLKTQKLTLEAWSPDSGARVVVGEMEPTAWLGERSSRFMTRRLGSRRGLTIVDVHDISAPVITDVPTSELATFQAATPSPDSHWLALIHRDPGRETSWIDIVDVRPPPQWAPREIFRKAGASFLGTQLAWSPNSTFVILEEVTGVTNRKRGIRIEIATGASSAIDYVHGPVPSNYRWAWKDRLAPDDRTVAVGRDGVLALWPAGAPPSAAAKLGDIREWAVVSFGPSHAP